MYFNFNRNKKGASTHNPTPIQIIIIIKIQNWNAGAIPPNRINFEKEKRNKKHCGIVFDTNCTIDTLERQLYQHLIQQQLKQ